MVIECLLSLSGIIKFLRYPFGSLFPIKVLKAFMENKGILVQMSIASIDTFKKAHEAAKKAIKEGIAWQERNRILEPYRDLMIRVAGYSAYFVSLSQEMREEIIARANFALKDGKDQHQYSADI